MHPCLNYASLTDSQLTQIAQHAAFDLMNAPYELLKRRVRAELGALGWALSLGRTLTGVDLVEAARFALADVGRGS